MARYELSDRKSNKFWEIQVEGASFTTTYGRIGTDGQSETNEFGDAAEAQAEADKVTASKVAKQLEHLDLSMGVMSDAGAAALVAKAGAFPKLIKLDVSDNYLSDEGIKTLSQLGVDIAFGDQDEADIDGDDIYRYVQLGE